MKNYIKKFTVFFLIIVMTITGVFGGLTTQSASASLKTDWYDNDYSNGSEQGEPKYYSITNAYISSYTSSSITFSWYSSGNNDGFYIYRMSEYENAYKKIGTVKNVQYNNHTFKDTTFKRGISFSYRIVAYSTDSAGNVTEGGGVSTTFEAKLGTPKLSTITRSGTKAVIKWKKTSGADGYEVFRKNSNGSYKKVKIIKSGSTVKWTAKSVSKTKTTKFKVRAYVKYGNKYSYGSFSEVQSVYSTSTQKIVKKFKKLQKQYPSGKYWNHVGKSKYNSTTITSKPCNHSKGNGLSTCNHYNCPNGVLGYQCYGFAWKMSDLIYGKTAKIKNFRSFAKCKMGDVIRYSGHSVIITEKHSNYVVVGECNIGNTCIIRWGRKVYKSELSGALYSRRYR